MVVVDTERRLPIGGNHTPNQDELEPWKIINLYSDVKYCFALRKMKKIIIHKESTVKGFVLKCPL